jgi:cytochrome c peroxidase
MRWLALALVLAGCPHHRDQPAKRDAGLAVVTGDALPPVTVTLAPAPPVPLPPFGLPALPASAALAAITPDQVALGELLFWDSRLASNGTTSCASCHDPNKNFSGAIDKTAGGEPNLRRTPSLANLAWASEYGWDGRFTTLDELMHAHVKGQLGQQSLDVPMSRLAALPMYAAHLARVGGTPGDAALRSLEAYVLTRYDGDAPWDHAERDETSAMNIAAAANGKPIDPATAGYVVFTGKGQCAVCHTPPLYSDFRYHRVDPAPGDEGRGKVDPKAQFAFRTPALRGAALHAAFLHDGRATTLEQALDAHMGSGSDRDPALPKLALTADQRDHVLAFVRALTAAKSPTAKPALP